MADSQSTTLEQELGDLLDQERFDPPEDFVASALITDLSEHEKAAKDFKGWWAEQARALHWFTDFEEVLDDSDPPFYKWFKDGTLNASYNCLDRHVENGLGERVAFHWRGEEGEERDVTYEDLLRDVKRFANALKDHGIEAGRRRRHLPADDPRGRRGHARLRAHRRAAQRRLRRLQRRVGQGAHGVLATPRRSSPSTARGARARRRPSSRLSTRSWATSRASRRSSSSSTPARTPR